MKNEPGEAFARLSVSLKYDDEQELQQLRAILAAETSERISLSRAIRTAVKESMKARGK
jgi:hypothetical protein